jgi:hypothetical protein
MELRSRSSLSGVAGALEVDPSDLEGLFLLLRREVLAELSLGADWLPPNDSGNILGARPESIAVVALTHTHNAWRQRVG